MARNFFINQESVRIDLDDEYWVKINMLGYTEYTKLLVLGEGAQTERIMSFLKRSITDWNLTDEKGEKVEYSKDRLEKLLPPALDKLFLKINEKYRGEKKSSKESAEG